ncbi:ribbon-helix-helix domain-containing protein [Deinococcus aestuarii]|uniref:ribbon-helix-helix domain-containing protein n=1 Tax=Deinococcus aestuarii TaxID=2774531 RepID=UPI001C0E112F|nr:ribbon-helix-helix domain-containing protein [Deinococcus aestuarii]
MTGDEARRVTVTLPAALVAYLDEYRQTHALASRSEAVAHAVRGLQEKELVERANEADRPAVERALRLLGGSPLGLKVKGSATLAPVSGPPIEELLPDLLGPSLADEEVGVSAQQQDLAERKALAQEVTEIGQEVDPY